MKYITLTISIMFLSLIANAQDEENIVEHSVGINIGFTSGHGFAYKYTKDRLGVQATLLPVKYNETRLISVGLTGFYTLKENRNIKTYFYLANSVINNNTDTEYNIGLGPGISVGNRVLFNFMVGYGMFDVNDTFNLLPTFELGLFYKL